MKVNPVSTHNQVAYAGGFNRKSVKTAVASALAAGSVALAHCGTEIPAGKGRYVTVPQSTNEYTVLAAPTLEKLKSAPSVVTNFVTTSCESARFNVETDSNTGNILAWISKDRQKHAELPKTDELASLRFLNITKNPNDDKVKLDIVSTYLSDSEDTNTVEFVDTAAQKFYKVTSEPVK